jgi:hypothetical protein
MMLFSSKFGLQRTTLSLALSYFDEMLAAFLTEQKSQDTSAGQIGG